MIDWSALTDIYIGGAMAVALIMVLSFAGMDARMGPCGAAAMLTTFFWPIILPAAAVFTLWEQHQDRRRFRRAVTEVMEEHDTLLERLADDETEGS